MKFIFRALSKIIASLLGLNFLREFLASKFAFILLLIVIN